MDGKSRTSLASAVLVILQDHSLNYTLLSIPLSIIDLSLCAEMANISSTQHWHGETRLLAQDQALLGPLIAIHMQSEMVRLALNHQ